jgi:hypothetical protein
MEYTMKKEIEICTELAEVLRNKQTNTDCFKKYREDTNWNLNYGIDSLLDEYSIESWKEETNAKKRLL